MYRYGSQMCLFQIVLFHSSEWWSISRIFQGQKTLLKLSANTKIDNLHNLKSLGVQSICNNDKMIFYHYCYVYNGPGTHLIEDKIATSYFKKLPNIE